jgi:hypothetical protein
MRYWFGWVPFCFVCFWTFSVAGFAYLERPSALRQTPGSLALLRVHLGEVFFVVGVCILIWLVAGREVATLEDSMLKWRREIWRIGWTREFGLVDIRNLRVGAFSDLSARPGKWIASARHAAIYFEYRGKVRRIGSELGEDEAVRIVETIMRRFPQIASKPILVTV